MDDLKRFLATGSCCAEALVRLGLQLRGEKNEPFANASAALCNGLWSRMTCGALSGGAMLLAMFDKRKACEEMIPELTAWFDETYGMEYGSVNCEDISAGCGASARSARSSSTRSARNASPCCANTDFIRRKRYESCRHARAGAGRRRGFFRGKAASNL